MATAVQKNRHHFHLLDTVLCRHCGTPADTIDAYPFNFQNMRVGFDFCGELISIFAQSVAPTPDTPVENTCAGH